MLGFSKTFVVIIFLSLLIWWKWDIWSALTIIGLYALIRIIYKFLT